MPRTSYALKTFGSSTARCYGTAARAGPRHRPEVTSRNYTPRVERKLATVLFVDLVGSTAARLDARPGGRAPPRDRVLRPGLALHRRRTAASSRSSPATPSWPRSASRRRTRTTPSAPCGRPPRSWSPCTTSALEARIGIESGEVVVDDSDSTFATGEAVNVAARLQQAAGAGRDPHRPVRAPARRCRDRRPRSAARSSCAASATRCRCWRVIGVRDAVGRVPSRLGAVRRPRVRARAARTTRSRASSATAARTSSRSTASRASARAASRASSSAGLEGATVLAGRCLPYGEGITYWPLAEMVKVAAGITDDDPVAGGGREAPRLLRGRGGRRPARRSPSGVLEAVETERSAAGDRLGRARVGGRARRRAAARARLRGHPLGRGAAARADRAPRRRGSATRRS